MNRVLLIRVSSLLSIALLLYACRDMPSVVTPVGTKSLNLQDILLKINGTAGVSLGNVDTSNIYGFGYANLDRLVDDSVGNRTDILYYGLMANDTGDVALTSSSFDGITLDKQSTARTWRGWSSNSLSPGGTSSWSMTMDGGVALSNASIAIPSRPVITNYSDYDTLALSSNPSLSINSTVSGGEIIVGVWHDGERTKDFLGVPTNSDSVNVFFNYFTTADDGTIEFPSSILNKMKPGRIYMIKVGRFRYETATRSDSKKVGLLATTSYTIPVITKN